MENPLSDIFRDWMRAGLKQPGKTQTGLAQHLNLAHPQVTHMLHGRRHLKVDEIPRIAEYLEIDPPSFSMRDAAGRGTEETRLRSALTAFGVDRDDLDQVVRVIETYVADDEKSERTSTEDQSQPASPRRELTPSGKRSRQPAS